MTSPYQGSGKIRQSGLPAAHKSDFLAHTGATAYRHTADQLDMNPELPGAFAEATVQASLETLASIIYSRGTGFISLGDGYDLNNHADFIVGSSLQQAFYDAFAHPRLENGGVLLVKSGTYNLDATIDVPPGIVIMGELGGTIINSQVIEQPMFTISGATDRPLISTNGILSKDPLDKNMFLNITLVDNIDGSVNAGAPCMTTVPMVQCETGSYLICEKTAFLGKMGALGAGPGFGRTKTLYAAGFTTTTANQSTLIFDNCTFDGLRSIVKYDPANTSDKLIINKCSGRLFGTELLADSTDPVKNCFVLVSGTMNISITDSFLYGTEGNSYIFAVVTTTAGTPIISVSNTFSTFSGFSGNLTQAIGGLTIAGDSLLISTTGDVSITTGGSFIVTTTDPVELNVTGILLNDDVHYGLNTRTLTRAITGTKLPIIPANWTNNGLQWYVSVNTQQYIYYPLNLPNGSIFTGATAFIFPAGSHGGLPATMPRIKLVRITPNSVESDQGTEAIDSSADVTAYELNHAITLSGQSITIDNTAYSYFLVLKTEAGANAVLGTLVLGGTVTFTTTYIDEA